MKSLFRSKPMTILLGVLIWGWMSLIARSVRWKVEGEGPARTAWASHKGIVIAAWAHAAAAHARGDLHDSVITDLGIDSLSMMQIVGELETELDLQIPDEDLVEIVTVGDLCGKVEHRLSA